MMDWSHTALVFPGQGSQQVGMGKDFAQAYSAARRVFEEADELLGRKLSALCFDGPEDALNRTDITQPALFVSSIAMLRALESVVGVPVTPMAAAGHSLGEFTALTVAGALPFAEALRLVAQRGQLMAQAGETHPGAMAAILGLDADKVHEVCVQAAKQSGRALVVANDNCPGQTVISGDASALDLGLTLAAQAGARKTVKLAVSVAAHSPLMESAAQALRRTLDDTAFRPPRILVYGNVSAAPLTDELTIREELNNQLTQSVRWTESVQGMIAAGATTFVEVGVGKVLTGLLRRIDRKPRGVALDSVAALRVLLDEA